MGNKYLQRRGLEYDNHGHEGIGGIAGSHGAETHNPETPHLHDAPAATIGDRKSAETNDVESVHTAHSYSYNTMSMVTGVAILEFGVLVSNIFDHPSLSNNTIVPLSYSWFDTRNHCF